MTKKLCLLLAAVSAFAFAVPALATAATGLTQNGVLIPVGKRVILTNVGVVHITSTKTGNITCNTFDLTGEVKVNTLAQVLIEGGVFRTSPGPCSTATGATATGKNLAATKLQTTGGGTGSATISFEVELSPGGLVCKYSLGGGTATYNPAETAEGAGKTTINEQVMNVTPAACGATAKLDGVFKIETDETGVPVFLM